MASQEELLAEAGALWEDFMNAVAGLVYKWPALVYAVEQDLLPGAEGLRDDLVDDFEAYFTERIGTEGVGGAHKDEIEGFLLDLTDKMTLQVEDNSTQLMADTLVKLYNNVASGNRDEIDKALEFLSIKAVSPASLINQVISQPEPEPEVGGEGEGAGAEAGVEAEAQVEEEDDGWTVVGKK